MIIYCVSPQTYRQLQGTHKTTSKPVTIVLFGDQEYPGLEVTGPYCCYAVVKDCLLEGFNYFKITRSDVSPSYSEICQEHFKTYVLCESEAKSFTSTLDQMIKDLETEIAKRSNPSQEEPKPSSYMLHLKKLIGEHNGKIDCLSRDLEKLESRVNNHRSILDDHDARFPRFAENLTDILNRLVPLEYGMKRDL